MIGIASFSFVQEMIPTAKIPEANNAKNVDRVLPQHFPTTYHKLKYLDILATHLMKI